MGSPACGAASSPHVHSAELAVRGPLRHWVKALVGVEVVGDGPLSFAVSPNDAWVLAVQGGRGPHGAEQKAPLGHNTLLTGIRRWTGRFSGGGNCVALFALLTPMGLVELMQSRTWSAAPRIRAPVHEWLDEQVTRALESSVAGADSLVAKLHAMAHWLETRGTAPRTQERAALRAARAAMRLAAEPWVDADALAQEMHTSRRQLERDFSRWLGAAPRHWAQVVRLQAVSRRAAQGIALADVAAELGFVDQAHMCNVVKQLTGLSPTRYLSAAAHPMGAAFRRATGGGTVYL